LALPPLLEVRNLSVTYTSSSPPIHAVRNVSLQISKGESLALVGETGSGKSTISLSALGLLDRQAQVESGDILFESQSVLSLSNRDWRIFRSRKIGIVFQDTRGALNPILSAEDHLIETIRTHQQLSKKHACAKALELLREVGISKGQEKLYPFELSGGACQRIGIALALCNNPQLLIADEPTSAVDSTIQSQILDLLQVMKRRYGLALLLISHDLPLISQVADRISVMYHGRIVESGLREEILSFPVHPYTQGLLQSQPSFQHHYETHPLTTIPGALPMPGEEYAGCAFAPRCNHINQSCKDSIPSERALSATHRVACIRDLNDQK
jgi:oligopeptide/dipeptide ABC transporter ATP-binding protein